MGIPRMVEQLGIAELAASAELMRGIEPRRLKRFSSIRLQHLGTFQNDPCLTTIQDHTVHSFAFRRLCRSLMERIIKSSIAVLSVPFCKCQELLALQNPSLGLTVQQSVLHQIVMKPNVVNPGMPGAIMCWCKLSIHGGWRFGEVGQPRPHSSGRLALSFHPAPDPPQFSSDIQRSIQIL